MYLDLDRFFREKIEKNYFFGIKIKFLVKK